MLFKSIKKYWQIRKSIGIKEEKISTAKKMLKLGIEIELIEQATGLTKEEILKWKIFINGL